MEAIPAANPDRLYEDFEPVCKWVREEGHDIVEVRLPGKYDHPYGRTDNTLIRALDLSTLTPCFKREQITIKINHLGFIVISGEQPSPSGEPKWRRFIKEIRVPDYCDSDAIRAKYAGHIVSVIMPKTFPEEGQELMERSVSELDHEKKLQEELRVKEVKDRRKKVQFKCICGLHGCTDGDHQSADERTEMEKGEMRVSNCRKPVRLVVVFAVLVALGGFVIYKYKKIKTEL